MNKPKIYDDVINYAKKNNINFCFIENEEITPEVDFNGICFLDTDSLGIPCSFMIDRAIVLNIPTPADLSPDDTGVLSIYDKYLNLINDLVNIQKPQYVGVSGAYVKLMCWCDWEGELDRENEFISACMSAIQGVKNEHWYNNEPMDFRINIKGFDDVTPFIFAANEIEAMWGFVKDLVDWDCEIYVNRPKFAQTSEHGVECYINGGLRIIKSY